MRKRRADDRETLIVAGTGQTLKPKPSGQGSGRVLRASESGEMPKETGIAPPAAPDASYVAKNSTPEGSRTPWLGRGDLFAFVVPYPPSTNNAYVTVMRGGKPLRVKSKAARDFTSIVAQMVAITRGRRGGAPPPPWRLSIDLYAPDGRLRDVDNAVKLLQDSLCRVLGENDSLVHALAVTKRGIDSWHPRAEVLLESVQEDGGRQ